MKEKYNKNIYCFKDDDYSYVEFIKNNGGFVYNDFGGNNVSYKKLHHYDCAFLHNLGGGKSRTRVRKICSPNKEDLIDWLNKERGILGKGYSECPCMHSGNYKKADFNKILIDLKNTNDEKSASTNGIKINLTDSNGVTELDSAKEFAKKLIDIYNNRKIPSYIEHFKKAGFTNESLISDKNKIFQLIILASYDQQPFTRIARGWEPIWFELPKILEKLSLFSLKDVKKYELPEIENKLKSTTFYNYHLDSKGTPGTSYENTFMDTLNICEDYNILQIILNASSSREVKNIQMFIYKNIRNIGPMIASKIIMYTMREIKIGKAKKEHFDLISESLLGEYHNNKFITEIEKRYGQGYIEKVIKSLKELGDPLAIDALYFVDRDEPQLKKNLL